MIPLYWIYVDISGYTEVQNTGESKAYFLRI